MPYMYSIDGGATFSTNNVFSALSGGTYNIVVNDALLCSASEDNVVIADPICGGSVGDRVWEDIDGNGAQDPGEPGVPNVRAELYNSNGNVIGITITDSNGDYLFDEVPPGDYFVRFTELDGYDPTSANVSGNANSDSDVDNSNGPNTTAIFTLSPGEDDRSRDFGVYKCIPLGELVWFDVNQNGIADNGENGINGLKVEVYKHVGNFWIKTDIDYTGHKPGTGSDDGYYKFCVSPGEYYVKFNNPPDRLVRTRSNSGSDRFRDSDITERFGPGTTDPFFVESGDEKCDVGAGFVPAGTIGDFVWVDSDNDGRRGVAEPGLPGVAVQAINRNGEMVSHAVTDIDGRYMLDMLPQDKYYVQFTFPEGYALTTANMGDETLDSDVDDSNGPNTTPVYDVQPGQHVESVDAGVVLSVLPVKWVSVTAEEQDGYNNIEWIIESEINVSHYEVEHSFDTADSFDKIGEEDSKHGTYSGRLVYEMEHGNVTKGINYYRVKQVDLDGKFSYSKTVSVNNERASRSNANQIKVYPNPVLSELNIAIDLIRNTSEISVNLYDNLGKKVADNLVLDINLNAGYKLYSVDVTRIPQGVYSLEIIIDDSVVVKKVAITN